MGFSSKDSELASQASNFSTVLAASAATYNETAATPTAVTAAVDAFVNSLNILTEARANGVRSAQMTAQKNSDRQAMLHVLRPIYSSVQDPVSTPDTAHIPPAVHIKNPP